jgi:hypothetical protein
VYGALKARRSNIQFEIEAVFDYRKCKKTKSHGISDAIAATWLAAAPLLDRCQ